MHFNHILGDGNAAPAKKVFAAGVAGCCVVQKLKLVTVNIDLECNLTNKPKTTIFRFAGIFRVSLLLLPEFGCAHSIAASIQHMA